MNCEAPENTTSQYGILTGSASGPIFFTAHTTQLGCTKEFFYFCETENSVFNTHLESPFDTEKASVQAAMKNLQHCCRR